MHGIGSAALSPKQVQEADHGTVALGVLGNGRRRGIPNPWAMAVGHVKAKAVAGRVMLMPREKSQPGARAKLAVKQATQPRAGEHAVRAGLGVAGNSRIVMHNM